MSHYGYADARPLLGEMGYHLVLYTAQNIRELSADLKQGRFDAVFFASNALNDKTIRDVVMSAAFKEEFSNFLRSGKGCLVLHQLRLAQDNVNLSFLPGPLDLVQPKVRDSEEKASEGNFWPTDITMTNVCFLYPNSIEISNVRSQCLTFRSLKGLYWHYFENVSRSDWDLLLYDVDKKKGERPLVAVTKESQSFRIVVCALTLDWQKQKRFLQNILTYVAEGRHNTAIIRDSKNVSATFNYFIECLRSDKYPFRIYDVDLNLSDFLKNTRAGVHTIVILDPFVDKKRIGSDNFSLIEQYVKDGKIKLIGIDPDRELRKFYVAGRERFALRLLHDLEMRIQKEIYESGYVDGSFWSTVESLQIVNEVPQIRSKFNEQTLRKTFEKANTHDRIGSYDEVFGVTCALLWLRAKYLGKTHADTQRTLMWIRKNLPDYEDREKALAYFTLADIGVATKSEKESLRHILRAQNVDRLNEIDLIVYLKAAIAVREKDVLVPIVNRLQSLQKDGHWIDLATTAGAATALLNVLALKNGDESSYSKSRLSLESMISDAIIYIQDSRENISEAKGVNYPWDNKASASLKCIEAWLRFEELIDLPVHEIIDTMVSYSNVETSKSSTITALSILEEIKKENRKLQEDNNKLIVQATANRRNLRLSKILWVLFPATLYILLSLIASSLWFGTHSPMDMIFIDAFITAWPFHLGLLTLVFVVYETWERTRPRGRQQT
jgi:hypothetical protein